MKIRWWQDKCARSNRHWSLSFLFHTKLHLTLVHFRSVTLIFPFIQKHKCHSIIIFVFAKCAHQAEYFICCWWLFSFIVCVFFFFFKCVVMLFCYNTWLWQMYVVYLYWTPKNFIKNSSWPIWSLGFRCFFFFIQITPRIVDCVQNM